MRLFLLVQETKYHQRLDVNLKMKFECKGISTLNSSSLKQVDKFFYLGSNVSSTESDINT